MGRLGSPLRLKIGAAALAAVMLALPAAPVGAQSPIPAPLPAPVPAPLPAPLPAAPEQAPSEKDAPADQGRAQVSGLPLPRFVSLRAGEVNMRSGPGVQYPVDWVYKRRHLPVEVIAEFQTWRKVRDHQGSQGWVHQTMLGGERTAIVLGRTRTLRAEPDSNAKAVAKLEPEVIVTVTACPRDGQWCRVKATGLDGWLRRVEIWGVRKDEAIQ